VTSEKAIATAAIIDETVLKLSRYKTNEILSAVKILDQDVSSNYETQEKLFVLYRYLFELPAVVRRDSPHFKLLAAGGPGANPLLRSGSSPRPDDELDALWPWKVDKSGRMRSEPLRAGKIRFGPPYRALATFEHCSREFMRRDGDIAHRPLQE
jgi:hypothetical protein